MVRERIKFEIILISVREPGIKRNEECPSEMLFEEASGKFMMGDGGGEFPFILSSV